MLPVITIEGPVPVVLQLYELAPVAFRVSLSYLQILVLLALARTVGLGTKVTETVIVFVQKFWSVAVTLNTLLLLKVTVMEGKGELLLIQK